MNWIGNDHRTVCGMLMRVSTAILSFVKKCHLILVLSILVACAVFIWMFAENTLVTDVSDAIMVFERQIIQNMLIEYGMV